MDASAHPLLHTERHAMPIVSTWLGPVSIAFLVGLLVGVCIGFTIGASPPPDTDRHGDK